MRHERHYDFNFYNEDNNNGNDFDQMNQSYESDIFEMDHPINRHEDVMQDEGVAEWTLEREQKQYMFKR